MFAKRSINTILHKASMLSRVQQSRSLLGRLQMGRVQTQMSTTNLLTSQPRMSFASFDTIEKASQKLNKALSSEIDYENQNYTQLEDIETFLNESGFEFKESDDQLHMFLSKEVGDKSIEIMFEAR